MTEVTLSSDSCSTPFVGIATQVADNVEKYSALSDQPGAYAVRRKLHVSRVKSTLNLV